MSIYFNCSKLPVELWMSIFEQVEDERTLVKIRGVCQTWKQVCDDTRFKGWERPYALIWQELPPTSFQTVKQAFQHRFCWVGLDQISKQWGQKISSVTEKIREIRQDIPLAPLPHEGPTLETLSVYAFWLEKFKCAYQNKDVLGQRYSSQELIYLVEAKGQQQLLSYYQSYILNLITNDEFTNEDIEYYFHLLRHLFLKKQDFKQFILTWGDPYILLYMTVRHGLEDILDIFIETNSDELKKNAPFFLAEAASMQQWGILQKMLKHSPPLACFDPLKQAQETALHTLCSLIEEEVVEEERQIWQELVDQLIHRGCSPLQENEMGSTPFHLTIKKLNSEFLDDLLSYSTFHSKALFKNLSDYFLANVFLKEDKQEAKKILRVLLKHQSPFYEKFNLKLCLYQSPWLLPVFLEYAHAKPSQLMRLFEVLLQTPLLCIEHLLSANVAESSLSFLKHELQVFLQIFTRQLSHIIRAGLNLNEVNAEQETPLHLLILSLRKIEEKLKKERQHALKDIFQDLFSISQCVYFDLLKEVGTLQNLFRRNQRHLLPSDLAVRYQYKEMQSILLLVQLQHMPTRPEERTSKKYKYAHGD